METIQIIHIPVSEEVISFIQRWDYERTSQLNVLTVLFSKFMKSNQSDFTNSELWQHYWKEYMNAYCMTSQIGGSIPKVVLPEWCEKYKCQWVMDGILREFRVIPNEYIPEEYIKGYDVDVVDRSSYMKYLDPFSRT